MTRRVIQLAFIVIATLVCASAEAASCGSRTPFLAKVADANLVVLGEVVEHIAPDESGSLTKMRVNVDRVLFGTYSLESVLVLGDNGRSPLAPVSTYPVGTRWVFALTYSSELSQGALLPCAESGLRVSDGMVAGSIGNGKGEATLAELSGLIAERKRPPN